jgi:biopolymer transport protein ExbD
MFENFGIVEHEAQRPEINLAPFVDTIMILLIFFVVTANLYVVTGVDVSKPKAQSARSVGQKAIMIGITREGTIHIFGRQATLDRLQNVIEQEVAKTPDCQVLIIADRDAVVGRTVQVMDKCLLGGAAKVSVAAEKE